MFEYKGTEEFDIGGGLGEYEYDFFAINGEEDFWSLINHYSNIYEPINFILDSYSVSVNNTVLSTFVKNKMKEHNANISLTFLADKYLGNELYIKRMIVNELRPDAVYDTYCFYYILQ